MFDFHGIPMIVNLVRCEKKEVITNAITMGRTAWRPQHHKPRVDEIERHSSV